MDFGKEIKDFRRKNNLTQKQASDLFGVSAVTVCRWEVGKDEPTKKNKDKIYNILFEGIASKKEQSIKPLVRKTREIVIINYKSGKVVAVDKDRALDEIIGCFDSIESVQAIEYLAKG